ncbi:ATP12-domain-containing protein [Schizopora paradoxa]|uniref:ATP12-domain-containing protein n=1 Tax=Schizopora paradoxa TaxID=27342 RepID=A0A0H2S3Y5_9AGAM|nr:ATP12-domain-containing protein [Schizopora paradoxa]
MSGFLLQRHVSRTLSSCHARPPLKCISKRSFTTPSDSPPVTATNRAELTMKRFWKKVDVSPNAEGITITLDKRPLKTPSGNVLVLPRSKPLIASLVVHEWENQEKVLKPHTLPVTSIASRAIDGLQEQTVREEVHASLLKYFDTDTICYHQDGPSALVELQTKHWEPLIAWMREDVGVEVTIHTSLFGSEQPSSSKEKLSAIMQSLNPWKLAALERATYTTKSFIIALALVQGRIDAEHAAQAAHVEVNSQIQKWGEVEDSHDVDYHDVRRQLGSVAALASL